MKLRSLSMSHYELNQALLEFRLDEDQEELHRFISYGLTFFIGWAFAIAF